MAAQNSKPNKIVLRSYNVGFGDCFLLSFLYGKGTERKDQRHILIDFGTSSLPGPGKVKRPLMMDVAKDISEVCQDKLDVLVVTHRHSDHISGFATGKNKPGDLIYELHPDVVVQPWTEDPRAPRKAKGPKKHIEMIRLRRKRFLESLDDIQSLAPMVARVAERLNADKDGIISDRRMSRISFLGQVGIKNASAVKNLIRMGKRKGARAEFAHYGSELNLGDILPGVKISVLGPPTIEQTDAVTNMRRIDEAEYWHLQKATEKTNLDDDFDPFPAAERLELNQLHCQARWLIPRLQQLQADQIFEIVRILDKVMNNTSLVLLFECGKEKLLFPGDAQIENWSWVLFDSPRAKANRELLEKVTLYKVGHHGSLNGTPKTLWEAFDHLKSKDSGRNLKTINSTKKGKHGEPQKKTEVPRKPLVEALEAESDYLTTEDISVAKKIPRNELCHKIELEP